MNNARAVMVAATRQHVGKTTSCLALVAALKEQFQDVGFMKPVGQRHILVEGDRKVDKDVRLFKEYFNLERCSYKDMSPVVIPKGYTRQFLDGHISEQEQIAAIKDSFKKISEKNDFTVVEGTGHCGVGSIVNLDNARVASLLGLDMILIVNGGLGSAFDELALNRLMCKEHNVKVRGVLLNKVHPDKVDMVKTYFSKALDRWDIPLLGVVPDVSFLSHPTMLDFENLFGAKLLCGLDNRVQHFDSVTLVAMGLHRFLRRLHTEKHSKTLFVTHASRADLILGFTSFANIHKDIWNEEWQAGLIIADDSDGHMPSDEVMAMIENQSSPVLHVPCSTYDAMVKIHNYTAKLSAEDPERTRAAIRQYKPHFDMDVVIGKHP